MRTTLLNSLILSQILTCTFVVSDDFLNFWKGVETFFVDSTKNYIVQPFQDLVVKPAEKALQGDLQGAVLVYVDHVKDNVDDFIAPLNQIKDGDLAGAAKGIFGNLVKRTRSPVKIELFSPKNPINDVDWSPIIQMKDKALHANILVEALEYPLLDLDNPQSKARESILNFIVYHLPTASHPMVYDKLKELRFQNILPHLFSSFNKTRGEFIYDLCTLDTSFVKGTTNYNVGHKLNEFKIPDLIRSFANILVGLDLKAKYKDNVRQFVIDWNSKAIFHSIPKPALFDFSRQLTITASHIATKYCSVKWYYVPKSLLSKIRGWLEQSNLVMGLSSMYVQEKLKQVAEKNGEIPISQDLLDKADNIDMLMETIPLLQLFQNMMPFTNLVDLEELNEPPVVGSWRRILNTLEIILQKLQNLTHF